MGEAALTVLREAEAARVASLAALLEALGLDRGEDFFAAFVGAELFGVRDVAFFFMMTSSSPWPTPLRFDQVRCTNGPSGLPPSRCTCRWYTSWPLSGLQLTISR